MYTEPHGGMLSCLYPRLCRRLAQSAALRPTDKTEIRRWLAPPLQQAYHPPRRQRRIRFNRQRLPGVAVHQAQGAKLPPARQGILGEVHGPKLIRLGRPSQGCPRS